MRILSRNRFINLLAGGMGLSGLSYLAYSFGVPEVLSRIGNRPNIVLISIDTLRADHFTPDFMPQTCRWVDDNCVRFSNAHANATWTRPSHLTMLTGLLPHEHQLELWVDVIPKNVRMVQQELRRVGYRSVALTGGGHLASFYGFGKGFDRWQEKYPKGGSPFTEAKRYLSEGEFEDPTFLFLHTYYVHGYGRIEKDFVENARKYGENVRTFDGILIDVINGILESPISDNLKMIITSDHGEGFGEEYDLYDKRIISDYHGNLPCPSQVRIPLAVYNSHDTARGSSDRLVGLEEVYHTVKVWAGFDEHRDRSLFSANGKESLLSETIPFYEPETGRGCAIIVGKGEYHKTFFEKHGKDLSKEEIELPPEVENSLKALGYL